MKKDRVKVRSQVCYPLGANGQVVFKEIKKNIQDCTGIVWNWTKTFI